jgi:hypothetical protein
MVVLCEAIVFILVPLLILVLCFWQLLRIGFGA